MQLSRKLPKDYVLTGLAGFAIAAPFVVGEISLFECPVHLITGIFCPGCGSQRAIRELLVGDISAAVGQNALIFTLPLLLLLNWRAGSSSRARVVVVGIAVILTLSFVVLRNLPGSSLAPS